MSDEHVEAPDSGGVSSPYLSFPSVIARAARLYRARFRPLATLFGLVTLVTAILSISIALLLERALPIGFVVQVLMRIIVGSFGMAAASVILAKAPGEGTVRGSIEAIKPVGRDVAFAGLFAGMLGVWVTLLLAQFGFILLTLFFGPPILIQIVALERTGMREARSRARRILSGQTLRIVAYLLVITLALGLLSGATLTAVFAIAESTLADTFVGILLSVSEVILAALLLPFLAAAGYVCYRTLTTIENDAPAGP